MRTFGGRFGRALGEGGVLGKTLDPNLSFESNG